MHDVIIIGGGIVGLATGYELLNQNPNLKIIVLEKESTIGQHQTGHNSGVIHSGIYYKPDSLKAKNCRRGVSLLIKFCEKYNVSYDMCGKIILATNKDEIKTLDLLFDRGKRNGIRGLKKLTSNELFEYEPYARGLSALYCPETGIVDYNNVCDALSKEFQKRCEIATNFSVSKIINKGSEITVSSIDSEFKTKFLINCAGLFSDQVAKLAGLERKVRIVPFRGEYYMVNDHAKHMIKNLIYPVPDPRFPFLGAHFTRTINGDIEVGPNAVLAWAREGYKRNDINLKEMWDYLSYKGFWLMAQKYWSTAISEYYRSSFKGAFVKSLQKLVPDVVANDISASPAGVRAQALAPDGKLIDDFVINDFENMIHVINAPSPAATSALAIGEQITNLYQKINNF